MKTSIIKFFSFQTNGLIKAHEILSKNFRSGIQISRSKKSAEERLQDINSCINNPRLWNISYRLYEQRLSEKFAKSLKSSILFTKNSASLIKGSCIKPYYGLKYKVSQPKQISKWNWTFHFTRFRNIQLDMLLKKLRFPLI